MASARGMYPRQSWKINSVQNEFFGNGGTGARGMVPKNCGREKLDVIGRPEITITKIAKGNPLGFKIKTALAPKLTLPDYRTIAREINKGREKKEPGGERRGS